MTVPCCTSSVTDALCDISFISTSALNINYNKAQKGIFRSKHVGLSQVTTDI